MTRSTAYRPTSTDSPTPLDRGPRRDRRRPHPDSRRPARRARVLGLLVSGALSLATIAGGPAYANDPSDLTKSIAADAYGAHDAIPRGVPYGYSWRTGADTDPQRDDLSFHDHQAINVWGQAFVTSQTSNHDVRLRVRNPRVWFLIGNRWVETDVDPGRMEGGYFEGDFQSGSTSGVARKEAPGVWSMSLRPLKGKPDALHWWWSGMYPRITIPDNARGILVSQEMRLDPGDGSSGISGARTISSTGADLFATPRTTLHPQGWNPGIPNPRMSYLGDEYRTFYNTTVSLDTLKSTT